MQGNARGIHGSGCKVTGECKGMQRNAGGMYGNAGDTRETYGNWCKVPGECSGMQTNARGMTGSEYKVLGKFRGMTGMYGREQSAR